MKLDIGDQINNYRIVKFLGAGSFGNVYQAEKTKHGKSKQSETTENELCALKIPIKNDIRDGTTSLLNEVEVYKALSCPEKGVANMKVEKDRKSGQKFIVMDLLGKSLELFLTEKKKLTITEVAWRAIQMIDIIRYIHSFGFIHRDLKPDNFVVGYDNPDELFCIDFGLAKRYVYEETGEHIPFSKSRRFVGTVRYASVSAHEGHELSRRDDLESIGYILVYLFKRKLPWQRIREKDKKKRYKLIHQMKLEESIESLCKGMPREFLIYFNYVKSLGFNEKPHYTSLKNMFAKLLE
jgi:serine/threonine protein kinase